MTRGDVVVERAVPEHLSVALDKLRMAGATVEEVEGGVRVAMAERPAAVDVVTLPFPGSRPTCSRWPSRWPRSPPAPR